MYIVELIPLIAIALSVRCLQIIVNPPYQEETELNTRQSPIYHLFMDESYSIGHTVELITPARFLFNAGQTPKAWNKKMLSDEHIKVLFYEADASHIFSNTEIKGGVAITIRNCDKIYGSIGSFTKHDSLDGILAKVSALTNTSVADVTTGAVPYRYSPEAKAQFPEYAELMGASYDLICRPHSARRTRVCCASAANSSASRTPMSSTSTLPAP